MLWYVHLWEVLAGYFAGAGLHLRRSAACWASAGEPGAGYVIS